MVEVERRVGGRSDGDILRLARNDKSNQWRNPRFIIYMNWRTWHRGHARCHQSGTCCTSHVFEGTQVPIKQARGGKGRRVRTTCLVQYGGYKVSDLSTL